MGPAALGAQAAGGIIQGIRSIYSGNAAGAAADYNANLAHTNAGAAIAQSQEIARRQGQHANQVIGQERANVGASGVALGGSALDAIAQSTAQAELQRRSTLYKGEVAAYGFESNARLDRMRASSARTSGYLGAAGSLLGTAGKMAGEIPSGGSGTLTPEGDIGGNEYGSTESSSDAENWLNQ